MNVRKYLLSILLLIGLGACQSRYPVQPVDFAVVPTEQSLARGKALVSMMCAPCHLDPATNRLTGREMLDVPRIAGRIYSRNITQHLQHGIGQYTDRELAYLLRTGIKRDGKPTPYMVKSGLSDADLEAIIAFLRSDDEMVKPADVENRAIRYSPVGKLAIQALFRPFSYPAQSIPNPEPGDTVAYGKYLVANIGCYDCHSKSFASIDRRNPEKSKGYMGGGARMRDISGKAIFTSNLTFDEETGIGRWNITEFRRAVREGIRKDHSAVRYPMPVFTSMTDYEVDAIFAYLKTVPVIHNKVPDTHKRKRMKNNPMIAGAALYEQYGCKGCHGDSGKGIGDLREAHRKYTNAQIVAYIRNPAQFNPQTKMATFDGIIAEQDYAPLAEYVRWLGENNAEIK